LREYQTLALMDQDSVRSTQQLLPESVSEGFPLMEGDTEEIPRYRIVLRILFIKNKIW